VQELFASRFSVGADDPDVAFRAVVAEVLGWAWRGDGDPPDLTQTREGRAEGTGGNRLRWALLEVPGRLEKAFELELRHPDQREELIEWRTFVDLSRGHEQLTATLRVGREATEFRLAPAYLELRRPRLVRSLLDSYRCSSGGIRLSGSARTVHVGEVERFISTELRAPGRTLPVVVVATASGALRPEVDPVQLADELAGLAHVVTLGGYLAWERFRDFSGANEFVPPGGVRIYWPGFGGNRDRLRHPYWTRRVLGAVGERFASRQFQMLARMSIGRVPRDALLWELRSARRELLRKDATETEDWERLASTYSDDLVAANNTIERLQDENRILEDELERQRQSWAQVRAAEVWERSPEEGVADGDLESPAVASWGDFAELAPLLEGEAFVLTERAHAQCSQNPYPDPDRMWRHLEALARAAQEWRSKDMHVGKRLVDWVRENYEIEVSLQDNALRETAFVFEGEEYSREPHVKVDDYKSPDKCGRIYFATDDARMRFVVDHIGLHL
jgi:hypothetical protein